MSRRSRSSTDKKSKFTAYIIVALAVIGALVAGKYFLDKRAQHFSELTELPVTDIQSGGTSLSGNVYKVTGEISERRILPNDGGILLSVVSTQGERKSSPVPIYIPKGIEKINLERNHGYTFKVEINREGLPVALDIKAQ
ncbi:MAG TPA: hypothetical protein DEP88_02345 [Verrucomicrobiales bacterium]|jgi:hypothetical protein|nr:hypothetical protein [Verrucomicrobiales bacterium]HCI92461.1 hypothetical protein [Verrucomicrobiales bacterium]HCL97605.1 hypothetical protein [Verrucomicrobiales bacterium]